MATFAADWLNLLIRWAHLVVGIGWIGSSFYFIALDLSLRKRERMNEGVYGTAWQVHGGGFYHVEKYLVAPDTLPGDLVWFRWEAYLTFVTGFLLLVVQYYWNARSFLIDPTVLALTPGEAIVISVASLVAGWFIYNALCRSPLGRSTPMLAIALFVLIIGFSILFTSVFSGRGALIHVGAFIGTIMAANVFAVIIPNQRKVTASLLAGDKPDARYGLEAKQRSIHNNYLTLPVLILMVSNHYPLLTGHPHPWMLVALILVLGGMVRHFLNRHDAGDEFGAFWWTLPTAAATLLLALVLTAPRPAPITGFTAATDADALAIVGTHCVMCHSAAPTHDAFDEPPKGVVLTSLDDLRRFAGPVAQQAVHSNAMPLGNETGMTAEERQRLGAWIAAQ